MTQTPNRKDPVERLGMIVGWALALAITLVMLTLILMATMPRSLP